MASPEKQPRDLNSPQQLSTWASIPHAVVHQAFQQASQGAREALASISLPVGQHILREDVPAVLHQAAGRDPCKDDIAALLRCFVLDSCATCSWPEFERSWQALQQLGTAQASGTSPSQSASTRRASAAVGPRAQTQAPVASQPATTQQEVGWHHAAAPVERRQRSEEPATRYLPLRGSDVTRGNEGRSPATYFGMYL
ncbi:hypothetical protein D9Q98_004420 [Chlorella vulgaris]|uniref:Uncharacterized protein n=1 Tax=Chlorella vulgaris TaxID=3077 RepID=A0A9D4TPV0_CHLVU|nr:hypothetical protein D9Q98_004420 [Chlorella vulgaris]